MRALSPGMASRLLNHEREEHGLAGRINRDFDRLENFYGPLLAWSVLSALEQRPQSEFTTGQVREAAVVCQRLQRDLEALRGWRQMLTAG